MTAVRSCWVVALRSCKRADNSSRLLSEYFGFDTLALRLLGAVPDDGERQGLRYGLARIVEAAGADTEAYDAITDELLSREKRKRNVNRFRNLGFAVRQGEQSVELADRSGDAFQRVARRTTLADALRAGG